MSDQPDKPGLFEELKRRSVFRVATLYAVVAWLLIQIGEATFEALGLPDGSLRLLIILVGLGFPIALVLGWIFDVTPEGVVRTSDDPDVEGLHLANRHRIDFVILGALLLAVGVTLWGSQRASLQDAAEADAARPTSRENPLLPDKPSIVVLPFDDLSPQGDQEYFAHGMSEELTNVLAQTPSLRVLGRTTAEVVKRRGLTFAEIGELLGVQALLEGSVRRSGNRLRITAQLIAVEDGFHLWSQSYERPMAEIFALQDELAREVASALEVVLVGRPEQPPTESLEAYESHLRGRLAYSQGTEEAMRAAIPPLEQALLLDPEYLDGLTTLGLLHSALRQNKYDYSEDNLRQAEQLARRALEIDRQNAEAHMILGTVHEMNYELRAAEAEFQLAIERDPGNAQVHTELGILRVALGDVGGGLRLLDEAVSLDPLGVYQLAVAGFTHARVGNDKERAIRLLENAVEVEPRNPAPHAGLALAYDRAGREAEALEALIGIGFPPETEGTIRRAYGERGIKGAGGVLLELSQSGGGLACRYEPLRGVIYLTRLERYEEALGCIEESTEQRTLNLQSYLKVDPLYDPIRNDPRFQAALAKMGLAD